MIKKQNGGFSLIELMVTVAIIAVLSGILLVNTSGSRAKARDAQRVSDLAQLQLAFALFYDRCGYYPEGGTVLNINISNNCPSGVTLGTFISQIPVPPSGTTQTAYNYATTGANGTPTNFILHAILESYNPAVAKGLSSRPVGYSSANDNSFTCSTGSTPPIQYCVTSK